MLKRMSSERPTHACPWTNSPNTQLLHFFERRSALAADDGGTVAAHQRVFYFALTQWAIERLSFHFFFLDFVHRTTPTRVKPQNPY